MTSVSQTYKKWYSVEIEAAREAIDAIEFALLELGALGTEINTLGKDNNTPVITAVGYFDSPPDEADLQTFIDSGLQIYELSRDAIKSVAIKDVEQRDWLAEWKKNWQPMESGRFIVAPAWKEISPTDDQIVILIEPGMAFGTGTHETTRLCLEAIGETYHGGSFLDVGTGTAILAIGAAKMFPNARIEACDTDTDSVTIARENAEINAADANIKLYEGSITGETAVFDYVCANLTADVILPILPLLVAKSRETLVLSGILKEQEESVTSELKKLGQEKFVVMQLGEWISIVVDRK
jgi:ribosomal protein L11 methyltransferase